MFFNLDRAGLEHVYVASHMRGILVISDNPMVNTMCQGASSNHILVMTKRVIRKDGRWVYEDLTSIGTIWLKKAFDEAVALTGGEPWRIYKLDAVKVAEALDNGVFVDTVRGFESRHEKWQPIRPTKAGETVSESHWDLPEGMIYADRADEATMWLRVDGWKVVQDGDGWRGDETGCNACETTVKYSPDHFTPLPQVKPTYEEAIAWVERFRPWE